MGNTAIVQTHNIVKDYPGNRALDGVDFSLQKGEVHVLFGENGAGKSTLISLLAGANTPTSGTIVFAGQEVKLRSVHYARRLGISAVFQEFSLVREMTVAENLFLGEEVTKYGIYSPKTQLQKTHEILESLGFAIHPRALVMQLTRAQQQMVEIAKAFRTSASVLILDEPTASLTNHETKQLFSLLRQFKKDGVGIVYITHRLSEIREIGDRITVLRDGVRIGEVDAKQTTDCDLIQLMTGRKVAQIFPQLHTKAGEVVLDVKNMYTHRSGAIADSVRGASVRVRKGEIVGLAGLVGSGKSAFARACFGIEKIARGEIIYKGELVVKPNIRTMRKRGMLYITSDRRNEGLLMNRSARENMTLGGLHSLSCTKGCMLNIYKERAIADRLAQHFSLTPHNIEQSAGQFSGGNQQKLMLVRSLTHNFDVVIFDEPTVGVDVGTRVEIYQFMVQLCQKGVAVVLVSSDLPEILHLSSRVYVFSQGKVQATLTGDAITEKNVLANFFAQQHAMDAQQYREKDLDFA